MSKKIGQQFLDVIIDQIKNKLLPVATAKKCESIADTQAIEFLHWANRYFEKSLFQRWEFKDNPDKGNWSTEELLFKFKQEHYKLKT